jgi:hypothetical protein
MRQGIEQPPNRWCSLAGWKLRLQLGPLDQQLPDCGVLQQIWCDRRWRETKEMNGAHRIEIRGYQDSSQRERHARVSDRVLVEGIEDMTQLELAEIADG